MTRIVNLSIVFKIISRNLFIISAALFFCGILSLYFSETVFPFVISSIIAFVLGFLFFVLTKKRGKDAILQQKEAYLTVTLSWIFISIIGSLPYIFSGTIPSPTDAIFESVSGFSTTGASILTDVEILPKSILFWRSMTHWIGGIGIIVLVIIVMPSLHIGGYHLFTLESSFREKIQPKIKAVGNRLLFIYILLTLAEIILLLIGKMSLFDSVCHAFGTVATGGFSTKNSSIINYSPYIQYVVMTFMLLAGTNFLIHYYLLKNNFKKIRENEEFKFYLIVVFVIGLVVTSILYFNLGKPLEESFREAFFQVISIITCTGFASADYLLWPTAGWVIIFFIMFLGGSTGSTSGGIKMARYLILLKNFSRIFRQIKSPHAIIPIRLNKNMITDDANRSILTFISVYMMIFLIGSISLIILGIDFKTSASSVATCMAGIGPGLGTVGPVSNFAHLPDMGKWILSLLMLIGRLEIYTFLVLFTRNYWMK